MDNTGSEKVKKEFQRSFGTIPILGMIHLAGRDPVKRALQEIEVFEEEGLSGAIVENYHGTEREVKETLRILQNWNVALQIGVNILPNEYDDSFALASTYGADFIQVDHVAGTYERYGRVDPEHFQAARSKNAQIKVLGGVWPKYYTPVRGSSLEEDIAKGMERTDAIVVTGEGTGKETPLEKITTFRQHMGDHPLIVGAGLTPKNAYDQLLIGDGAIVGSALKEGNDTEGRLDRAKIRDLMDAVLEARAYKSQHSQ